MKKKIIIAILISLMFTIGIFTWSKYRESFNKKQSTEFGWYSVIIPEEFDKNEQDDLFIKTTSQDSNQMIKLYLENGNENDMENEIQESLKTENITDGGKVKIGKYHWRIIIFKGNGSLETVQYYTKIDDNHYVQILTFCIGRNDKEVERFLKSFRILKNNIM